MKAKRNWLKKGAALLLLAAGFLFGGGAPGKALDYESGVRSSKSVSARKETVRSFQMEYQVWSEDWVGREAAPCDVILLLEYSSRMKETASVQKGNETRLERLRADAAEFLEGLGELSPNSRAGLVFFGGGKGQTELTALNSLGRKALREAVAEQKASNTETLEYAEALERAQAMAEAGRKQNDRPLYLVTVTAGDWAEEGTEALAQLQELRKSGARSYTVSLCGDPPETAEEFWQSMSSAPLSTHHYVSAGELGGYLKQIRRDIAAVLSVEVVQRLDPRFTLSETEQKRLREEGAHLLAGPDGAWEISWEVPLPRNKSSAWTAALTFQAREEFPGGNDIVTDGEGSGIYRAGEEIAPLTRTTVNVPLSLVLADLETELFSGEKVKTWYQGKSVEEALTASPQPAWFGKGKTGSFSYFWETEEGSPVGSLKQLNTLRPASDTVYRLKVTYRPYSEGVLSAGSPVKVTEKAALYRVKLKTGKIRIKARAGTDVELDRNSSMQFRLERDTGETFYRTAFLEADPEGGKLSLEGELSGLPFGVYTVIPTFGNGLECTESFQVCRLGVWEEDDTISTDRAEAQVHFTLKRASFWKDSRKNHS